MLKKDVKKITMERDGALKHLSLTTGIYVLTLLHSQIYSISLVTLIATFSTKLVCMYTCAFLFVCWGRPVTSREIWFLYYTRSILCSCTTTAPSFYYMYFSLESLPLKAKKYTKSTWSLFFQATWSWVDITITGQPQILLQEPLQLPLNQVMFTRSLFHFHLF